MQKKNVKITTFEEHLDNQYGKRDTKKREQFEEKLKKLKQSFS